MTKWNGEENFFKQKLWRIYARIDSEFKLKGWNNSYYLIPLLAIFIINSIIIYKIIPSSTYLIGWQQFLK